MEAAFRLSLLPVAAIAAKRDVQQVARES